MQTKNYLKIGLIISLIAHVGFFAVGGYVMSNMTNSLNSMSAQKDNITQDDITYVDIQLPKETTTDDITSSEQQISSQSDITVTQENIEVAPKIEQLEEEKETPKEEVKQNIASPTPATSPKEKKPKYRKLSDLNIRLGKIDESQYDFIKQIQLDVDNPENLKSYNPTIKKSAEPVYDHNLIPEGEEIFVIVEYIMDDNGKIIQADFKYSSEDSDPDLSPEVAEDLNAAALEALQKFEIIPPRDKKGNIVRMPYQQKFKFTHDSSENDAQP